MEKEKTNELVVQGLHFSRKANDMDELKRNEIVNQRDDIAVVEKVVVFAHREFVELQNDLLSMRSFIQEHCQDMRLDEDERWHCILAIGAGHTDGILIESEGFSYPRYAARLEDADLIDLTSVPHVASHLDQPVRPKRHSRDER